MNKVDLLRAIVTNVYSDPTAFGGAGTSTGIRREGRQAFRDLAHVIFETPRYLSVHSVSHINESIQDGLASPGVEPSNVEGSAPEMLSLAGVLDC
jgi:hypothetical protein